MNESLPERDPSQIEKARIEIRAVEQIILRKGAADGESGELKRIEDELLAGEISPDEAEKRAHKIAESRQDYH